MGKVEEVARAVWAERQRSATEAGLHLREWDDETPLFREDVRREARAAIKAMREPTEAMILDGYNALMEWDARTGEDYGIGEVWRAMIDAALSEDKEQG